MAHTALVRMQHLRRDFGAHRAVDDLSLELDRGEVVGLLGPNGAGKSTTMRMLAGSLPPSAGTISIDGLDLLERPRQAKRRIGYLPEQPPLYRELTVDEYLLHCARLRRLARAAARTAVAQAKRRCGLAQSGARLLGNLSKGYQQRVGIAQAILHSPELVILDEPTAGLDPNQIQEIRGLIRELGRDHAVMLSTHILPEVLAACSRVEILHEGRLVFSSAVAGLGGGAGTSRTRIGLRRAPDPAALRALPGVSAVEALGDGAFRLHHAPDADLANSLVPVAVRECWELVELVPERASLEEIFSRLTSTDAAAPPEAGP